MTFEYIYSKSILYWPDNIDLTDGEFTGEAEGFYSPNLSLAWDKAEGLASDEWESLMVWIQFQELHENAVESFKENVFFLRIDGIEKEKVKQRFNEALQGDGYEDMLHQLEA